MTERDRTDAIGREALAEPIRTAIASAFASVPDGKRGALLVRADLEGSVTVHLAARLADGWRVAGGLGFKTGEKRPSGYVAIERTW